MAAASESQEPTIREIWHENMQAIHRGERDSLLLSQASYPDQVADEVRSYLERPDAKLKDLTISARKHGGDHGYTFTTDAVLQLLDSLEQNHSVTRVHLIDLKGRSGDDEARIGNAIAKLIRNNQTITDFTMEGAPASIVKKAAIAMKDNFTVKNFGVHYNSDVGGEPTIALADMVRHNSTLESLRVCPDTFASSDFTILAAALSQTDSLKSLYMNGTSSVSEAGLNTITDGIVGNTGNSITHVDITHKGETLPHRLIEQLRHNQTTQKLRSL